MTTNLTYERLYSWESAKFAWIVSTFQMSFYEVFSRCDGYAFDDSGVWPAQASEPQPLLIDLTKEMEEKP